MVVPILLDLLCFHPVLWVFLLDHVEPVRIQQNRKSFMCRNVVIGMFEPPTGGCFERVRFGERGDETENMAVMFTTALLHITFCFLTLWWQKEGALDSVLEPHHLS